MPTQSHFDWANNLGSCPYINKLEGWSPDRPRPFGRRACHTEPAAMTNRKAVEGNRPYLKPTTKSQMLGTMLKTTRDTPGALIN